MEGSKVKHFAKFRDEKQISKSLEMKKKKLLEKFRDQNNTLPKINK